MKQRLSLHRFDLYFYIYIRPIPNIEHIYPYIYYILKQYFYHVCILRKTNDAGVTNRQLTDDLTH